MDITLDRRAIPDERPARGACLVAGCPCKDARIISTRRVAFFAEWARRHAETADRFIEPDPEWRGLTAPWLERLSKPERPGLGRPGNGPSQSYRPGA